MQCDSVEPWQHGSVLRTPSVPDYWDGNAVRVEAEGVSAEAMLAAADRYLADAAHRKLDVEDGTTGAAARPFFAALGWLNDRHAMMARSGAPPVPAHTVVEVPVSATRALRTEWAGEYGTEDFVVTQESVMARRGVRAFMTGEDGFVTIAVGPGAIEIDSLFVTASARGRGLGASLIAAALAAGGEDLAWVVADDEGQARPLYERLGFVTRWRFYSFVRVPG